ncbi:hyaluronate lyase [Neobacillus niacini]|uniref:polysaccharide lyase family 8 super-sandwich domain-containing protein n=1 Tax=Neobacillus driksii TaxID=3035913 RepID=UPI002784771A|nr:polysaccharide lyase family 8 super-sandwich domain-containing protein [Neobacillus niacini]MDQ0973578.1 hyaluronate lyase [Neobacillus niacini]
MRRLGFKMVSILVTVLLLVPMFTAFDGKDVAAAETTDEYTMLREKWKGYLTGGSGFDRNDPDISSFVKGIDARVTNEEGTGAWDTMDRSENRKYLWSDLTSTTDSADVSNNYYRLKDMALAYSSEGSKLYQNQVLKQDIISGLDWMYANRYNEKKSEYGNWWNWEIGAPMTLKDILVVMYEDLSADQIDNYTKAIDRFVPDPTKRTNYPSLRETGANRMDKALIVIIRGIVGKSSERISTGRDALSQVFEYVTDGDGFYKDGSFVQHNYVPYNGSYGIVLMDHLADVLYILAESTWKVTDPNLQNVYNWVFDSFEPLIYKGAMMDMTRGRAISREGTQDHSAGRSVIIPILQLSEAAPPDVAVKIKSMVKYWIESDKTFDNYVAGLNINDMLLVKRVMKDSSITPRGELVKHQVFAAMDQVVHRRPGFGFGMSMSSKRIANFEYINGENKKGWYTGDGMTYLYNNDLTQFSDGFWPTVDMFRLPGTTTDGSQGTLKNDYYYLNSKTWVGGSSIDGLYGATGMEFDLENSSLTGKKSWFSFDDEIVALGAGITGSDDKKAETIVENRKLNDSGNSALTVNRETKSNQLGWSETMEKVNWAHLKGDVQGADIGYYFPGTSTVSGLREARTGSWKDINIGGSDKQITNNYISLALDHGVNPNNASYSYVVLPNKSSGETEQYSQHSDIDIVSNTSDVQAVKEKKLGLIGANFWNPGEVDFIRSYQPASVMVKETGDELTLSISDPTQTQDQITLELGKIGSKVMTKDDSIKVVQTSPYIKVEVDVAKSLGKTHTITFKTTANGGKLPSVAKIDVVMKDKVYRGDQVPVKMNISNSGKRVLPGGELAFNVPEGWVIDSANLNVPALHPNETYTLDAKLIIPEDVKYDNYKINAIL